DSTTAPLVVLSSGSWVPGNDPTRFSPKEVVMIRRSLPARVVALIAVFLFVAAAPARADDKADAHKHAEHFMKCAKACGECSLQCASCSHHCAHLVLEGKKDHA